jgi:uncharacterized protein YbjT (DUF2867 family)
MKKGEDMSKSRILVTGATGKTGSVAVTELLMAGYPVRATGKMAAAHG